MSTTTRIPSRRMDQVLNPWDAQRAAEAADQTHEEEEKAEEEAEETAEKEEKARVEAARRAAARAEYERWVFDPRRPLSNRMGGRRKSHRRKSHRRKSHRIKTLVNKV
jgi:hypothetical protein